MQTAVMSGAEAFKDACSERYHKDQMRAMDAKEAAGEALTRDEMFERSEREGAEYARLDQAHRTGLVGLSDEDAAKYKAYNEGTVPNFVEIEKEALNSTLKFDHKMG